MTQTQAFVLVLLAYLLAAAGATWLFGPYGLLGSALILGAVALLVNLKE